MPLHAHQPGAGPAGQARHHGARKELPHQQRGQGRLRRVLKHRKAVPFVKRRRVGQCQEDEAAAAAAAVAAVLLEASHELGDNLGPDSLVPRLGLQVVMVVVVGW